MRYRGDFEDGTCRDHAEKGCAICIARWQSRCGFCGFTVYGASSGVWREDQHWHRYCAELADKRAGKV
jgi:hypothetical protein